MRTKNGLIIKLLTIILVVMGIIAYILMLNKVEPISTFFTPIIWWLYIGIISCIIYLKIGNSYKYFKIKTFIQLIIISLLSWLIFEIYNLFTVSWIYIGLPDKWYIRYLGYVLSFTTILPGIFFTEKLLMLLIKKDFKLKKPLVFGDFQLNMMILFGVLCLLIPVIFANEWVIAPVWIGFIFLLEPYNYRHDRPSLLNDFKNGNISKLVYLLFSGILCGFIWEFWNYYAGAKWIYNVPYIPNIKLFEMPVIGYIGFPVFAVECYSIYNFLRE